MMSECTPPPDAAATRKGEYRESRRHLSRSTSTNCMRPRLEKRKPDMAEDDLNADINRFLTAAPRSSTEARRCFSPPEDRGFRTGWRGHHRFIVSCIPRLLYILKKRSTAAAHKCSIFFYSRVSGISVMRSCNARDPQREVFRRRYSIKARRT